MTRPQSRAKRQAAFMAEAKRMFEHMEEWYDAHPQASFGELETEARKRRRELMGKALAQLVNGRDVGALAKLLPVQVTVDVDGQVWQISGVPYKLIAA